MIYHLANILWMNSVEHSEKVVTIRVSVPGIGILKKLHYLGIILEHRMNVLYREFIIFRHIDEFACRLREE